MNILKQILFICLVALGISSCSSDDNYLTSDPFVVAFVEPSKNLGAINGSENIAIIYSDYAESDGVFTVSVNAENATYGIDFTTEPASVDGKITLQISKGQNTNAIAFHKLNPDLDETTQLTFTVTNIEYPNAAIRGYNTFKLNSSASEGGGIAPEVGGPNQQFQVYVDLSNKSTIKVQRDSWDLAFFSKDGFRVGINGSIFMAAAQLNETNIDNISQDDVEDLMPQVAVGTFEPSNEAYIDYPDGDINRTAISEISLDEAENKVYLVNLGFEVGTEVPANGSVALTGNARGWKKIRVLRNGDGYVLQYANLNDTTHREININKSPEYNATFFSFTSNSVVNVEPEADKWDLNFTVFTNIIDGAGSYGYSDVVLHNRKGGVTAYSVTTDQYEFDTFLPGNIIDSNFKADQRVIGASWRDVMNNEKDLVDTIFYIIKDANNNVYKLKFTALLSEFGERGYPEFKYELLQ
ncbi:HmuY family protein [Aequorivita sp. SDUM287046]|uniref:HmuY family protein n=1 Tax=Aequorivita aurantiaca TaxID=3053356 RepID=A0ABT8DJT9_9FLAO|nr:HmuY family protein [Aequorivita aurantiaca]MDN3725094.1 HmuY family protein [Aequorivita aurantiaca]